MNFEKLTDSFWRLQISGWLIYLVLIYITFFSVAAEGSFLRLLHIKITRQTFSVNRSFGAKLKEKFG